MPVPKKGAVPSSPSDMFALAQKREDEAKAAFKKYDKDNSNSIDSSEVLCLMKDMGLDTLLKTDEKTFLASYFEKYDQMVSGVNHCANYAQCDDGGLRTIKSAYQIQALHMKFNYFMEHTYDPAQQCLTFHLDYDRKSDLDDSVGYWYVQPTSPDACRVYYSCECKLRGWVPGPVYDMLTKKALQQATTWVSAESLKEWDGMRDGRGRHGNGMVRFVGAMRDSLDGAADRLPLLRRLQPPGDAVRWVDARRRDAVRFVSSPRLVHSKASWGGLVSL